MPKKTAASARLRSRQNVNVDFYKVSNAAGGPAAFRNALQELITRRGATRRIDVRGERIDVHHIERNGVIFEGELGRLRSHDVPAIAAHDCSTKDIDLQENESITERTAFLFDYSTGMLAIHAKREAVSASKLADLCDVILQNQQEYFELLIQLTPDAEDKFNRMNVYKSFRVSYGRRARARIQQPDLTTRRFLRSFEETEGEQITIAVSAGKKRDSKLSFQTVRDLLSNAEGARNEGVEELKVTGRGAADEVLAVNLISDRMRGTKIINVIGQSASYELRRTAVRQCYEEQRANF